MKSLKSLLIILSILVFSCQKDTNEVSYSVSPVTIEGQSMLKINMSAKADIDGETAFLFLNNSWGEENLHNTIHSVKSLDPILEVTIEKDSGWVLITHPNKLKKVNLEYILKQDTEGDLTSKKMYRPVIQSEYFHVFSHSLFMIPLEYSEDKELEFDVSIEWKDFPEAYKFQNSFGTNQKIQNIKNTTEGEFIESVFLGGDYRTYSLDIKDNTVAFTTRGDWITFKDSTMLNVLDNTITAQRDFWKDHSQKYFSVNLSPTVEKQGSSFQGTGLNNSFDCSASNSKYLEVEGLVYLFNHELLHNWIGHLIKNANEEEQYWFSEGFTEYYTNKNIAKYSIYELDKGYYIDKVNEIIRLLYASPVKEAPNSEINYDNFWQSRDYEKLPYRRGALLAFYLDYKIKKDSNGVKSLDDLMLAIKEDAKNFNQKLSHDYFISKANLFLTTDFKPFFDTHIEEGKLFDLETLFKDFGFEFHPTSNIFDLGFTFTEDKRQIATVDENSEAYKAGMRKGDLVRSRSYYYGSKEHEAEFILVRDRKDVNVKYLPVKEAKIPQLKNNEANKDKLSF